MSPSAAGVIPAAAIPLSPLPTVSIGGVNAAVGYAGIVSPGLFQINVTIPAVSSGLQTVTLSYGGVSSPPATVIVISN